MPAKLDPSSRMARRQESQQRASAQYRKGWKQEKIRESARTRMARFTLFSGGALTLTDQPLLRRRESLKEAGGEDLEDYRQQARVASVKNRARTRYQKCMRKVAELAAHDAMMDAFVVEYDAQMAAKKLDAAKNLADDESDEDGATTPLC
ncbi:hypothetical protein C8J57DRAFT_1526635 [Mycena rebaudengoi]|nr:hypothetical protein C8J57DRAFT_1526635 [Mycena rebaudengoi]